MTGSGEDTSESADIPPPEPDEAVDEVIEPATELRTAQEQDAASGASPGESGGEASDARAGDASTGDDAAGSGALDEVLDPVTEVWTVQEREAASRSEDEAGDGAGGDRDA